MAMFRTSKQADADGKWHLWGQRHENETPQHATFTTQAAMQGALNRVVAAFKSHAVLSGQVHQVGPTYVNGSADDNDDKHEPQDDQVNGVDAAAAAADDDDDEHEPQDQQYWLSEANQDVREGRYNNKDRHKKYGAIWQMLRDYGAGKSDNLGSCTMRYVVAYLDTPNKKFCDGCGVFDFVGSMRVLNMLKQRAVTGRMYTQAVVTHKTIADAQKALLLLAAPVVAPVAAAAAAAVASE
jgi:hypothetical protein